MTTVYIVTSGSYSDYHISRVFLDAKKAETYSKTVYDSKVEVWEAADDLDFQFYKTVTATLETTPSGLRSIEIDISLHTELDDPKEQAEQSMYFNDLSSWHNPRELLQITRVIPLDVSDEEVESTYKRVCEDLYAEIRGLIDNKRWTSEMVDEWLSDKGNWYSNQT